MSATPTAADRARGWLAQERKDGLTHRQMTPSPWGVVAASLAALIAEAVAHERERAALTCEERRALPVYEAATFEDGCTVCAAAIRAREGA